jgi:hypothetical protein
MPSRSCSVRAFCLAACLGLAAACADAFGSGDCEEFGATSVAACPMIIGEQFCSEGGQHVDVGTAIAWMHDPPHSGDHYPVWATSGEHTEVVERGYWVHNLEHGSIVLLHNCVDGCDAALDLLRSVLAARPDHDILLIPDPLLTDTRFAALSWTWVHAFDEVDVDELLCFVDQHYNHSPEIVH